VGRINTMEGQAMLKVDGPWFVDGEGRRVLLRGVNLGGSTKVPATPNGATHIHTDYGDHRSVSFVGRPFALADADEHYRRLQRWGFNCLRFLTTWEAIEHAGPGEYDEEYLDYLYAVVKKAGEYGFTVFIDPHQDVWSRMSGGDGAPGWTLEMAGFDLSRLDASEAAVTMAGRYPEYPRMVWPTNNQRLASATMFTLFFAGDRFAPHFKMGGEGAQSFLQRHFVAAMRRVAERMADLPHVVGYDSLNEPSSGFIGVEDLSLTAPRTVAGPLPAWFDLLVMPAGVTRTVPYQEWSGLQLEVVGEVTLNPQRVSAWKDGAPDIWREAGVWDFDAAGRPQLLRRDHFAGVRFFADCVRPFVARYSQAVRAVDADAVIFIEGEPNSTEIMQAPPGTPVVNASHWYDECALFTKHFDPHYTIYWGNKQFIQGTENVRQFFCERIGWYTAMSRQMGNVPTLIGEFGLQFDLDDGQAYQSGDYQAHVQALGMYYDALDANLAHATQWNYTADNDNRWGDQWNQEDLSIYSRDQRKDPQHLDSGGRAVAGFCRPHLLAAAGLPLRQHFDTASGAFTLVIAVDAGIPAPTRVYVPRIQYPQGVHLAVSSGQVGYDAGAQMIEWSGAGPGEQTLTIVRSI